jgi:hypothetical protein
METLGFAVRSGMLVHLSALSGRTAQERQNHQRDRNQCPHGLLLLVTEKCNTLPKPTATSVICFKAFRTREMQ